MHVNYLGFNSGNYGVWSLCKWLILCVRPSIWSWGVFAVTGLSRPPGQSPPPGQDPPPYETPTFVVGAMVE